MLDWYVVLNAVADYLNRQLKLLKVASQHMSIDPKICGGVVKIEMNLTPADGKIWEEILEPLGARKQNYEFAILFPSGTWRMSEGMIRAYSEKEAEERLRSELEAAGFPDVSGILLMREWKDEEE